MRESKKDKRDHKYGMVHRKNRELRNRTNNLMKPFYDVFYRALGMMPHEDGTIKAEMSINDPKYQEWNKDLKEKAKIIGADLEELWNNSGINWEGGYEEFCRFLRYHGHSNHGYVHADFLKRRQKEWDKQDRKESA